MEKKQVILILFFLLWLNINCSQSSEINTSDDENLIASSQMDPEFSSDGNKIVFKGLYDSLWAIHFIDIEGNYLGYIKKQGTLSSPSWSPDNKKLALSLNGNICTMLVSGG